MVTADDGTWGFGLTLHSGVTVSLINEHIGPMVEGENCMATERIWDLMQKATAPYGTAGVSSFAISAVDNALWDLKGKLLRKPVYELIGGPQKEKIFCYAMAPFINSRCYEQIKCSISAMDLKVNLIAVGVGIGYADAGPTHYSTEDICIMKVFPNITIYTPSDLSGAILKLELSDKTYEAIIDDSTTIASSSMNVIGLQDATDSTEDFARAVAISLNDARLNAEFPI